MHKYLKKIKMNISYLPEVQTGFRRWLFVNISSVLFADKAGELLNLFPGRGHGSLEQQLRCIESLSSGLDFSFQVLFSSPESVKVVIYKHDKLQEALSESPKWALREMGYGSKVKVSGFLAELRRRWMENRQIPDEIGLALGYPVKDVLGFMGLIPDPCTGVCGWRIHGDPEPSIQLSRGYEQARYEAKAFLGMSVN